MVETEGEATGNNATADEPGTPTTSSTRPGTLNAILPHVSVEKRKELHKKKVKGELLALIEEGILPSLAGDSWSEGGIAIFGILVYFIDAEGVYHQKLLRALPFGGVRHTGDEIQKATKRCAATMGIGSYKQGDEDVTKDSLVILEDNVKDFVHATVSDSASNIVSGWGCFDGHECNCHLMALCVLTYLESPGVKETFKKLRGMTTHFNHSVMIGRKLLHECQEVYSLTKSSPPQDNATRSGWKGARNQAKWFRENQEAVQLYDVEQPRKAATAVNNPDGSRYGEHKMALLEWDIVKESLYFLEKTAEAIDLLQTTSSPTAGLVLPVVGDLINKIDPGSKVKYNGKTVKVENVDVQVLCELARLQVGRFLRGILPGSSL
ncbi:hypothetical protein CYMTET_35534 [Cymbomonas tetramitiformis]|uniref:Uncharacterized protein n=1 Tax=Cymbomonas tetramitiformis TaxID=36881 RepID=A0AAE0F8Y4_9CHLO|nr:hypothetical protein CYMTET_35534 [Cymbomonas tetramitiformis]